MTNQGTLRVCYNIFGAVALVKDNRKVSFREIFIIFANIIENKMIPKTDLY